MTFNYRNKDYYYQTLKIAYQERMAIESKPTKDEKRCLLEVKKAFAKQISKAKRQGKNPDEFYARITIAKEHIKYVAAYFHKEGYFLALSTTDKFPILQWVCKDLNQNTQSLDLKEKDTGHRSYDLWISFEKVSF